MNSEEWYLRKGVLLADEFVHVDKDPNHRFSRPGFAIELQAVGGPYRILQTEYERPLPIIVGALAAQLVRQMDETSYRLHAYPNAVYVVEHTRHPDKYYGISRGTDRNMNIIRAVVDSKILEK